MTALAQTAVWLALRAYAADVLAGLSLDVAWPEDDGFVPGPRPFVAVSFQPGPLQRLNVPDGGAYALGGVLSLLVMFPASPHTFGQMHGTAELLASFFPDSLRLVRDGQCVQVAETAAPGVMYRDGNGRAAIPLAVRWTAIME